MYFLTNKSIRFILAAGLLIGMVPIIAFSQTTYYSKATGAANLTATWGTNTDGTGTAPGDFITGDIFNVRSGSSLTTSNTLLIDDAGIDNAGNLIIANGGLLTASHSISFASSSGTGTLFEIENGGRYVHGLLTNINTTILTATTTNFIAGSTFEMNTTGTHTNGAGAAFANFTISNSVTVTFSSTIVFISGVLTINSGSTLRFSNTGGTSGLSDVGGFSSAGTGLLRVNGSTNNVPTGISWTFPVNYERSAAGNQRIQSGTYSTLNATGGNRDILAGALVTISGTFTPGAGTYTIGSNSTFEYSGNGSLTIPTLPYENLTISGTGTKSLGANLTVANILSLNNTSGFLSINGNTLTLNGTANVSNGKMIGSSTSNLTIGSSSTSVCAIGFSQTGSENQLNTLTLNRTGVGGGAILNTNVNIFSRLILTSGNLNTNNQTLGLLSTSIANTARVDQVGAGASISYGSGGGIRAERFIPSGFRSYRDLTPSVQTFSSNILNNWQENGAAPAGYGTHITGVRGGAGVDLSTGLDITQTGNASMFTYTGSTFPTVTNTASTPLDPFRGYRILIRGDRNVNLYTVPTPTTMNVATTLRATGRLIYGDVSYSTGGVTNGVYSSSYSLNSATNTGFSLIGNPYAAPVSWGKILDNGSTVNIQSTYWYFDPLQGINGIYAVWLRTGGNGSETGTNSGVGSTNNFIQPGQAIFIRNNNSTSPAVRIEENDKDVGSGATSVFSIPVTLPTPQNKLGIILQKYVAARDGNVLLDGSVLLFNSNSSNAVLTTEDAGKISNGGENLAIVNNTNGINVLSIESRKLVTENDIIPLRLWNVVNNDAYILNIIPTTFSSNGRFAFLNDAFLKKQTFIRNDIDTIKVDFTSLRTDSTSFFNRFSFVFKQPTELAPNLQTASLTGTNTGASVLLNWKLTNDNNQLLYDLEKSTNGIEFTNISRVYSNGSGSYSFKDSSAITGKIYYRVRYYNNEAQFGLTNTVLMQQINKESKINIYPNPITGKTFNIQLNQLEAGNYQLAIIDNTGKVLTTQIINNPGGLSTLPVSINTSLLSGLYRLRLTNINNQQSVTTNIIFQK